MNTEEKFMAGIYKNNGSYKSFYPSLINKEYKWQDERIVKLLEEALIELGELNAFSELVPDIDSFIKMHIAKEAISSSKIEGTKTEIDELFIEREEISSETRNDKEEVLNYISVINWAVDEMKTIPLSMRLLKGTHKILLSGVRGKTKLPGEIRKSQNWIGGANLKNAFFIPPNPADLSELLSDLEKFWHNEALNTPHLIKAALSHYQFETIHPFLDGNGRTGRLLIIIYLMNFGLLAKPSLYLSSYFDQYRSDYYDALTYVRTQNNMDYWIKFFLDGVILTSRDAKRVLKSVIEIRKKSEHAITMNLSKSRMKAGLELIIKLFSKPSIKIDEVAESLGVSFQTASNIVEDLIKLNILKERTGGERNRIFEFWEYLDLFRSSNVG